MNKIVESYDAIYLDLENTIISHFSNWIFLENKIQYLRSTLELDKGDYIKCNIFSYAIWCEDNVKITRAYEHRFLDYGIIVEKIVTTEDMYNCFITQPGIVMKAHTDVWSRPKEEVFQQYCRDNHQYSRILLYDDTTQNNIITYGTNTIRFLLA